MAAPPLAGLPETAGLGVSQLLRAWTAQRVVLRDQARPRPRLVRTVRRWTSQRRTDITTITQQDTNANSLSRPPYIFR
jgi:hypothetical protein